LSVRLTAFGVAGSGFASSTVQRSPIFPAAFQACTAITGGVVSTVTRWLGGAASVAARIGAGMVYRLPDRDIVYPRIDPDAARRNNQAKCLTENRWHALLGKIGVWRK
jgi:hypothetical protein